MDAKAMEKEAFALGHWGWISGAILAATLAALIFGFANPIG